MDSRFLGSDSILDFLLDYKGLEKRVNMDRKKLTGLSGRRKGKKQVKKLGFKVDGRDDIELRFGTIAVEKGFVTAEQIIDVMKLQITEDIEKRKHRLIGRILLEERLITLPQIDKVLDAIEKQELGIFAQLKR